MRAPQREVEECFARLSAGAEQQEPTAANSVRCPPDRGEKASVDRSHLWAAAPDRPTGGKVWRSTVDVGAPNERRQRQRTCSLPARPGGKCERGATAPLSQEGNYESELAGARRRRARKLRLPSQERLGVGFPDPNPSCSGGLRAALAALRKRGAKRRAVSGRGSNPIPNRRSEPDQAHGPVREPLGGWDAARSAGAVREGAQH